MVEAGGRSSCSLAMELCGASAPIFAHSRISSSVVSPSVCASRWRFRVCCLSTDINGPAQSLKEGQMTVSVTGATGFIGKRLVQRLLADNHSVHVLTRSRSNAQAIFPGKEFPKIVITEESDWKDCIEGSNAVVNLAGMPISTRWSPEIKKEIKQSRTRVTSKVVELINKLPDDVRPTVLVSATAVGYYGVINGTAPNPVRLGEMCEHLGSVMGRPSWLPVPELALKAVLGEGATVVLEGQRVLPARAKELGFSFKYPYVKEALKDILT